MTREGEPVESRAGAGIARLTDRGRSRIGYAAFALLAYVPVLLTDTGRVASDTKTYLYLDPSRFLAGASSMWDPKVGMGTVSHQTIGYLFPMGPFYWLLEDVLGLSASVSQRLWLGTLVLAAGLGMRYLLRVFGVRGPGVAVSVLAYAFTPYVLQFSPRLSVLLGPWAALPWMLAFVVLALRHGGWRYPALFAIAVQLVGGVNASALLFAALGPALWIPYAVFVLRDVSLRRALNIASRIGGATLVTSLWWMSGLWVQGKYGLDVLRFSESIRSVSVTLLPAELVRGIGYWFFYGQDRGVLWNAAVENFTQRPVLIIVSFVVPSLAMLAAAVLRWRSRAYFVLTALVGMAVAVAASPYDHPSIVGSAFKSFATNSTAGFALRSTARAVPLIALGLAALLGAGVTALHDALRSRGHPWRGVVVAATIAVVCLVNAPGVWNGAYYSDYLERSEQVPRYWQQALSYLDGKSHQTRVLALPGADFAVYRWGETVDPIEPGLMDRPFVARELIPWGSEPSANLLQALDRRLQEGVFEPRSLAPIARLMGVGDVLLRMDLDTGRFNLFPADQLWRMFSPQPPSGLGSPVSFGARASSSGAPAPVAAVPVDDALPIVRTKSTSSPLLVDGDGEGLMDVAGAGLLDATRPVFYSASFERAPDALRKLLTPGAGLVVTDSNRRQAQRWQSLRFNYGYTEQAGERPLVPDLLDQRLEVFPGETDSSRTVVELHGVASVQATRYGTSGFGYTLRARPTRALDGDVNTAWEYGTGEAHLDPELLRIVLSDPVTTDHLNLVQPNVGHRRWINKVTLRFDDGTEIHRSLGLQSRTTTGQDVSIGRRRFSSVEIRIDSVGPTGQNHRTPVGFAEVRIADETARRRPIVVDETLRMPQDLLNAVGTRSSSYPLAYVMTRYDATLSDEFSLPTARAFALQGVLHIATAATDDSVDRLLGRPDAGAGGVTATSSGRYLLALANRAAAALDDDPRTAWVPPPGQRDPWIRVRVPTATTIDRLSLNVIADGQHAVPSELHISSDEGGSRRIELPAVGAQPGADRVAVPVRFSPLRGREFTVTVTRAGPVAGAIPPAGPAQPVGIAELGIPGVHMEAVGDLGKKCRTDLLSIDGKAVSIRLHGTSAQALRQGAVTFEPCRAKTRLALDAGVHRLRGAARRYPGVVLDRVVLASPAPGAPTAGTRDSGPRLQVVKQSRTSVTVRVDGARAPFWMILGQSRNAGWAARADGHDLGAPQLIDGYANGWYVQPGADGRALTITMQWKPQRTVRIAVIISGAALLLCVVIVVSSTLRMRRRSTGNSRGVVSSVDPPMLRSPFVVGATVPGGWTMYLAAVLTGLVAAVLVRPWAGLVVAGLVLLVIRAPRWRAVLSLGPAAILSGVALYIAYGQYAHRYTAGLSWPTFFEDARTAAWFAIVLLAADVVVGLVYGADRTHPPPGSDDPGGHSEVTSRRVEDHIEHEPGTDAR